MRLALLFFIMSLSALPSAAQQSIPPSNIEEFIGFCDLDSIELGDPVQDAFFRYGYCFGLADGIRDALTLNCGAQQALGIDIGAPASDLSAGGISRRDILEAMRNFGLEYPNIWEREPILLSMGITQKWPCNPL